MEMLHEVKFLKRIELLRSSSFLNYRGVLKCNSNCVKMEITFFLTRRFHDINAVIKTYFVSAFNVCRTLCTIIVSIIKVLIKAFANKKKKTKLTYMYQAFGQITTFVCVSSHPHFSYSIFIANVPVTRTYHGYVTRKISFLRSCLLWARPCFTTCRSGNIENLLVEPRF